MSNNNSSEQYKDKVQAALKDRSTLVSIGIFVLFLAIAGFLIFTNQGENGSDQAQAEGDGQNEASGEMTDGMPTDGQAQQPTDGAAPQDPGAVQAQTGQTYTVEEGESLWAISEEAYGSGYNWVDIVAANNLVNPDYVPAGTELTIPSVDPRRPEEPAQPVAQAETPAETGDTGETAGAQTGSSEPSVSEYTVKEGDTLWSIAEEVYGEGYAWTDIVNANNIINPDYVQAGTTLTMPSRG